MSLLKAKILNFRYDEDNSSVLENIDLEIYEGELVVITGLSGCGKTTLTRILNGLIPNHYNGILNGEVKLLDKNLMDYRKGELAKYIGNVFQNPSDQFFATIADEEVAFVGENLGMPLDKLKLKTKETFEKMGISDLMDRKLSELSGGQKQKVAIASTLLYDTKIIFFDEPSSNLDYHGILQFKDILSNLRKMGKTVIIVEHRLFFLNDLYDRLIYMKNGTIERIFSRGELTEDACKEYGLRAINYKSLKAENLVCPQEQALEVSGLNIKIGNNELITNLYFSLNSGEIMAIIGQNGIGKTTLGKTLSGLIKNNGKTSYGKNKKERLKNSYYMMQDVDYQIFFDTVENELLQKDRINDNGYLDRLRKELKHIDLWENRYDHPQNLSGGQKQRLALLTACLSGRKLIILDEPTSGLDYKRMNDISQIIKRYSKTYPFAIITHDIELIFKVCNSVLMLGKNGYKKVNIQGHEKEILEFIKDGLIV
ncbi:TPA: ABC transporter ATP-binding protein [Streptococcus pyogenes]|uniref:ABC transporter, ATP-binding protein n=1 Tax=Anaerococcus prevotii ACS-065-V-Col13 TaxID=879305 RepID=F0GWA0_9FIRM|nr:MULTISPECIES: ABC transporter ATP-binding protein [Peptoniphilaceae]MDU4278889.1 ABC transporter ATP-binding protein [Finegoldia magna]HEO0822003.1 ABC transporter ATP-binding protein [Streptococcus agalactiae]HER5437276.1 ABC transporter ATP-binding protein [Streptococcus pyogenes]EGC81868.1 ABC transporter, ATP-binding protein [Anaerococcus prevotii ACS-065-V-Col13]MDU1955724.1 ABC transporter ATP-binding protein [Peptoniphilus lacydonensis]